MIWSLTKYKAAKCIRNTFSWVFMRYEEKGINLTTKSVENNAAYTYETQCKLNFSSKVLGPQGQK